MRVHIDLHLIYRRESQSLSLRGSVGTRLMGVAALAMYGGIHYEIQK